MDSQPFQAEDTPEEQAGGLCTRGRLKAVLLFFSVNC